MKLDRRVETKEETLAKLNAEEKIRCNVSNKGIRELKTICIYYNGVPFQVAVGESVEVPVSIYNQLKKQAYV